MGVRVLPPRSCCSEEHASPCAGAATAATAAAAASCGRCGTGAAGLLCTSLGNLLATQKPRARQFNHADLIYIIIRVELLLPALPS